MNEGIFLIRPMLSKPSGPKSEGQRCGWPAGTRRRTVGRGWGPDVGLVLTCMPHKGIECSHILIEINEWQRDGGCRVYLAVRHERRATNSAEKLMKHNPL